MYGGRVSYGENNYFYVSIMSSFVDIIHLKSVVSISFNIHLYRWNIHPYNYVYHNIILYILLY